MDNANTKQKLIIQIVSLLLSIGLWFYVTSVENPILVNDLNKVPVEIVNVDSLRELNLALTPNQEFYVSLKLEGLSQDLRKVKREDFEIKVDLSDYALKKGTNKIQVEIVDFPSKINVKNSSTLSVNIDIEEYVVKEIPVKSNIEIIAKPNYYVAPAVFNPSTVKVSGPSSVVDRVEAIVAEGQEANVSETIVKTYTLDAIDIDGNVVAGIELSNESVEATININEGRIVPIKLKTIGELAEGLKLTKIELTINDIEISGPKELLDTIEEISTDPIDLSTINDDVTLELALQIPEGIQINAADNKVNANISVEKLTSKEFLVGFNIVGVNEGLKVIPKSEKIKVVINGFKEDLDKLTEQNIKVELDASIHTEPGIFSETPKIDIIEFNNSVKVEELEKISYELVSIVEEETP